MLSQLVVLAAGAAISRLLSGRFAPAIEDRARTIKGNPDLLRLVIAFMRRLHWIFLIVYLWIARFVLQHLAWPADAWLLSTALTLASAWFVISVLTRIIRNRSLARAVAIAIWSYVALSVLGMDEAVVAALDRPAVTLGTVRISLLLVLKVAAVTVALIWLAVFLGNVFSHWIDRSEDLSPSFKVLIGKLAKIGLIILAGTFALAATGVDLTALAVFSGAVGVGIGFGLQKVVSNFISGIIILLDKSIKPGDTITLGETFGWVRDLRARFVSVITRDGREYLIPNEDFITERVVNWSFSSEFVRIDVDFGVAYDSDPHEVSRIAIETAMAIERVSDHRAPVCWLTAFGSSSLDFKLRFWISDPREGLTNVRGQVLIALWDRFKAAGISIPFPHREIIMRTPVEIIRERPLAGDPAPDR
ncbi:MAG: mechanosensitive ion channel family protein [Alphaproteobacteria bacterium]